jgi:hypothetical protein
LPLGSMLSFGNDVKPINAHYKLQMKALGAIRLMGTMTAITFNPISQNEKTL